MSFYYFKFKEKKIEALEMQSNLFKVTQLLTEELKFKPRQPGSRV